MTITEAFNIHKQKLNEAIQAERYRLMGPEQKAAERVRGFTFAARKIYNTANEFDKACKDVLRIIR